MPIVKSVSKRDSVCSHEKDGTRCTQAIITGKDYLWDTDVGKAYCINHEELNSKATTKSGGGGGGYQKATVPLCRNVEDAIKASEGFNAVVIPAFLKTMEQLKNSTDRPEGYLISPVQVFEAYVAIYLGKHPSGTK